MHVYIHIIGMGWLLSSMTAIIDILDKFWKKEEDNLEKLIDHIMFPVAMKLISAGVAGNCERIRIN